MKDQVEFWLNDSPFLLVDSSMQPMVGDVVNIRGENYCVTSRNFAVDRADDWNFRKIRLAVNIERVKLRKKSARPKYERR
jgi:hypothetical protein